MWNECKHLLTHNVTVTACEIIGKLLKEYLTLHFYFKLRAIMLAIKQPQPGIRLLLRNGMI